MAKNKNSPLRQKIGALRLVLVLGILVLLVKFAAYAFTGSNAILSDALESLINIAASGFALFSVIYGARLKDSNHPYGHGKMETVAVGFEGALILLTGLFIIIKSIISLVTGNIIREVDLGIYITSFSAVMLAVMSLLLNRKGKQLKSDVLLADGKHLQTDVFTSLALVAGLVLFKFTGYVWIDSALAMALALHIIFSGYSLVRKSLDNLMDKADPELLEKIAAVLEQERNSRWIDMHHLKVQKFGSSLHVDCHVTMPFYLSLEEVHSEIKNLERTFNRHLGHRVEVSVHTDPCMQQSCGLCHVSDCSFRKEAFVEHITWNAGNLVVNKKHSISSRSETSKFNTK
jgi:cation diffusion facilitator family transporter